MNTPPAALIARAVHFLELAKLQLSAGHVDDAAQSITTAVENLEKVEIG